MKDTHFEKTDFQKKKLNTYSSLLLRTAFLVYLVLDAGEMPLTQGEMCSGVKRFKEEKRELPLTTTIIEKALQDEQTKKYDRIIENPFLISLCYYSDTFLKTLDSATIGGNSILRAIKAQVNIQQLRNDVLGTMDHKFQNNIPQTQKYTKPIQRFQFGVGRNHPDAIDLFTQEGASVHSISTGIVLLAESSRDAEKQFSTSSYKGGNSIIVYDPREKKLYRYVHLQEVLVSPGQKLSFFTKCTKDQAFFTKNFRK